MSSNHSSNGRLFRCVSGVSALMLCGTAAGQTIEYTVTDLPMVADASTVPLAMNDQGAVVGWAQYYGGDFYLRGWHWSADQGLTLLPPPPGAMSDRYRAVDINNLGVISGDGGGDSGRAWRFEDGAYTIVDLLDGLDASAGGAINIAGDLVATAFDSQHFTTPTRALLFTNEGGTVELFPQYARSGAADINDAGQITAGTPDGPVRVEPDGSLTFLPVPPGFAGFSPGPINAVGDIAGIAACEHECNQAALWTEDAGYQIIPWVGTRHGVGGLNNHQEVVGWVEEGVSYAWIWSPNQGLRLLAGLIDPDLTRNVVYAMDINNAGQILAIGYDYSANRWCNMLLTPVTQSQLAPLTDFTVAFGSLVSGGLEDLVESDNSRVRTRSRFGFTAQEPNVIDLRVGAATALQNASSLDLTVEGRINQSGGTSKLRLRNWSTNSFQQVHQYPIGVTETVEVIEDVPAMNRVRQSDGRIEVSIRQSVVTTFTAMGFDSFTDQVAITVQ